MEEEEDDMYAPDEGVRSDSGQNLHAGMGEAAVKHDSARNDMDEGEEGEEVEEEESDSV